MYIISKSAVKKDENVDELIVLRRQLRKPLLFCNKVSRFLQFINCESDRTGMTTKEKQSPEKSRSQTQIESEVKKKL